MENSLFNFAISVVEYFESKGLKGKQRSWDVRTCHASNGTEFNALALNTGDTFVTADGRTTQKCAFFSLSKALTDKGEILSKDWIKKHHNKIMLIPAEAISSDTKFGVIYLPRESTWDTWDF